MAIVWSRYPKLSSRQVVARVLQYHLPYPSKFFLAACGLAIVSALVVALVKKPTAMQSAVLIDERAVGNDLGKKFVLVLKPDNTLEYRPVTLGTRIDGLRVVEEGLAPADVIVVNGLQHVTAGAKVQAQRVTMSADGGGLAQVAAPDGAAPKAAAREGRRLLVRAEHPDAAAGR